MGNFHILLKICETIFPILDSTQSKNESSKKKKKEIELLKKKFCNYSMCILRRRLNGFLLLTHFQGYCLCIFHVEGILFCDDGIGCSKGESGKF